MEEYQKIEALEALKKHIVAAFKGMLPNFKQKVCMTADFKGTVIAEISESSNQVKFRDNDIIVDLLEGRAKEDTIMCVAQGFDTYEPPTFISSYATISIVSEDDGNLIFSVQYRKFKPSNK